MAEREGVAASSAEGWRILIEVVETGQMTLKSGEVRQVSTKEVLAAARYLASLQPPREKRIDLPEDWKPAVTHPGGKKKE